MLASRYPRTLYRVILQSASENQAEGLLTLLIKDSRLACVHITDGSLLEEPV